MKNKLIAAGALVALGLSGCATQFESSAPAGNNGIYVVGAFNNRARLWKCPSQSQGKCETLKVNVEK